jgi:hypothetical protein
VNTVFNRSCRGGLLDTSRVSDDVNVSVTLESGKTHIVPGEMLKVMDTCAVNGIQLYAEDGFELEFFAPEVELRLFSFSGSAVRMKVWRNGEPSTVADEIYKVPRKVQADIPFIIGGCSRG